MFQEDRPLELLADNLACLMIDRMHLEHALCYINTKYGKIHFGFSLSSGLLQNFHFGTSDAVEVRTLLSTSTFASFFTAPCGGRRPFHFSLVVELGG